MSWVTEYFARADAVRAAEVAEAEHQAVQSGKERFDLARFEALLNRGSQAARERQHLVNYYVLNPEIMTLAGYAKMLLDGEPWEDTP